MQCGLVQRGAFSNEKKKRDDSAALKEQMVWMETCPGCGVPVAASGSLFLLHLGHCSPDLLDRLLSNNNQLSNVSAIHLSASA